MSDKNNLKLLNKISNKFYKIKSSMKKKRNLPDRPNGDQYYYISDFDQTNEKKCIDFDKMNENIYQNNLKIFNNLNKKLEGTPFNINNEPLPPPKPNNYEKYCIWKKRNIKINCLHQSMAVIYLLSKNINIKIDDIIDGIEPHDVLSYADKISIDCNENILDKTIDFLNKSNNNCSKSKVNNDCNKSNNNFLNNTDNIYYRTNIYPSIETQVVRPSAPPYSTST